MGAKFQNQPQEEDAILGHAAIDTYSALVGGEDDNLDEEASWLREQRAAHKSFHWLRRPLVITIGLCLFVFAFSLLMAESLRQMIQFQLACNTVADRSTGSGSCDRAQTQVLVSSLHQAYSVASGVTMIFALGMVGPLLDKYGRKPFLAAIPVMQAAGKFMRLFVMQKYPLLQFNKMVVSEVVANLCGGIITFVTLTLCYVSDIAEAHQRTYFLGLTMASLFIGLLTGPLFGNLLLLVSSRNSKLVGDAENALALDLAPSLQSLQSFQFLPLRVEASVLLALSIAIIFVLPELRLKLARRMSRTLLRSLLTLLLPNVDALRASSRYSFFSVFPFLRPLRLLAYPKDSINTLRHESASTYRWVVLALIICECLMTSFAMPLGEVFVLYGIYQFGWTAQNLGHLMATGCSCKAVALIVLSPLITKNVFQKRLGLSVDKKHFDGVDFSTAVLAFGSDGLAMIFLAFAPSGSSFLFGIALTALGTLAAPAMSSAAVKYYPESKMGEVFGAMALLKNLLGICVPFMLLSIYKNSLAWWDFPQAVFYFMTGLFGACVLVLVYARRILEKEEARKRVAAASVVPRQGLHHLRNLSFS